MSNVAIIPARGGSKRIPMKNIKPFAGKPIIAYSIIEAKKTQLFKRIIVSTDSEEIAKVSRDYGAEIPFMRPPELSNDYTGINPVILHALQSLLNDGEVIDYICCVYPTAPLITSYYIRKGYELIKKSKAASALSVTTFPSPIFRALTINDSSRIEMVWPKYFSTRSQDLPQVFHDAGQFCWANAKKYLEEKTFLASDAVPVVLPRYFVQDIDTLEDWKITELLYEVLELTKNKEVTVP
jgi:pseudaminic acid cytidylyltransferase